MKNLSDKEIDDLIKSAEGHTDIDWMDAPTTYALAIEVKRLRALLKEKEVTSDEWGRTVGFEL